MTQYNIPFDMKFEDKAFGGKLTLKQFAWFACLPGAFTLLLILNPAMTTTTVNGKTFMDFGLLFLDVSFDIILLIVAAIFAFIKVNGDGLGSYTAKTIGFNLRQRVFKFYQ